MVAWSGCLAGCRTSKKLADCGKSLKHIFMRPIKQAGALLESGLRRPRGAGMVVVLPVVAVVVAASVVVVVVVVVVGTAVVVAKW